MANIPPSRRIRLFHRTTNLLLHHHILYDWSPVYHYACGHCKISYTKLFEKKKVCEIFPPQEQHNLEFHKSYVTAHLPTTPVKRKVLVWWHTATVCFWKCFSRSSIITLVMKTRKPTRKCCGSALNPKSETFRLRFASRRRFSGCNQTNNQL
mgnify:CR=1 FL=1